MSIEVVCPSCDTSHKVKDESAGKKLKCKSCRTLIPIPAAAVAAVEADPWENLDENEGGEELAPVVRRPATKQKKKKAAASSQDDEPTPSDRAEAVHMYGIRVMIIRAIVAVLPLFGLQLRNLGDNGHWTPVVGGILFAMGAVSFAASQSRILDKVLTLGSKAIMWGIIGLFLLFLVGVVAIVVGVAVFVK